MRVLDDYLLMVIPTTMAQFVSSPAVQLQRLRKKKRLRPLSHPPIMTTTTPTPTRVMIAQQYLLLPSSENLPCE
jgi:hypothetical protein